MMNRSLIEPDLSDRPHDVRIEREMLASSQAIYHCFTTGWERWFALEGALIADPVPNGQLFFVVEHEDIRYPHYGRFLTLEPNHKVELTWLTGKNGTQGAETVLSIDLTSRSAGCMLTLTHRGFYDEERADHHGESWKFILAELDKRLTDGR
jgi:uncharacterized protein YndB with AHSA1/START domain